jgi:hypothetical protein
VLLVQIECTLQQGLLAEELVRLGTRGRVLEIAALCVELERLLVILVDTEATLILTRELGAGARVFLLACRLAQLGGTWRIHVDVKPSVERIREIDARLQLLFEAALLEREDLFALVGRIDAPSRRRDGRCGSGCGCVHSASIHGRGRRSFGCGWPTR